MDGYAVIAGNERDEYRVIEFVPAGRIGKKPLTAGTAVKVMTGAAVPENAGKVIMVEHVREDGDKIFVVSHSDKSNICLKGEDVRRGDVILRSPAVLGPLEIGNLISVGITQVEVFQRIRVGIISTGDEIVDEPGRLVPGRIMNVNGPMLEALCDEHGLEVVSNSIVPDDAAATKDAIGGLLERSDMILVSGGVSVGDLDFVNEAMTETGLTVHFSRVAVKPGKPMTFASKGSRAVFGMPGNPVSVFVMFHLFVLRAARVMRGLEPEIRHVEFEMGRDYQRRKVERMVYVPCLITAKGMLEAVEYHGPAHLQCLLGSDGFFVMPRGVAKVSAGERVRFISIKGRL
jgi:molybdopterin molybdotransferase